MRRCYLVILFACFVSAGWSSSAFGLAKSGNFLNPISDMAWEEILPIKIGGVTVSSGSGYDTPDQANFPLCVCPIPIPPFFRVGIPISLWEPARLQESVTTPFYFPVIGTGAGGGLAASGTKTGSNQGFNHQEEVNLTFFQNHWMIYPVWAILQVFTDMLCMEESGFDMAYITELDPLWNDPELALFIQPEALLFANPFAQMACIADSISVNIWRPLEALFWCDGGESVYPLTGHVSDAKMNQASFVTGDRMMFKLSRQFLLHDTAVNSCMATPLPIWVKPHYKKQPVRPMVKRRAWPVGKSEFFYGAGLNPPFRGGQGSSDEYLYMIFRKRVCCVL